MNGNRQDEASRHLGLVGALSLVGFLAVFVNIPWQWNMFMDDTLYNQWMPAIGDIWPAFLKEVREYWTLGRFYPVKYLANLLKWRFLPNDPYVFRYFNLLVYLSAVAAGAMAALTAVGITKGRGLLLLFAVGASVLHKPLLEVISLNPIGETWVCLFLGLGAWALFSRHWFCRYFLARFFFLLVALAKEPAALVFFASSLHYLYLAWAEKSERKKYFGQAALDLVFFAGFFSLALYTMAQGSFTKGAYFNSPPWLRYVRDFFYRLARYALWTSPFLAAFCFAWRDLWALARRTDARAIAASVFFALFAASYLVFMSTQGIVAYQETPASMALYGLFLVLVFALWRSDAPQWLAGRKGAFLLLLFCVSYFISVSRWERFVRGIVEPRQALDNVLEIAKGDTVLVPVGEIISHVNVLATKSGNHAFQIDAETLGHPEKFRGRVFVFEFPYYMGNLDPAALAELERSLGGWRKVIDARSYRIYVGNKEYP